MASPDALKRLEEIAWMHRDGYMCASSCDTCYLLKLARALLESQGELMKAAANCGHTPGVVCFCRLVLDHAERVRRGEV